MKTITRNGISYVRIATNTTFIAMTISLLVATGYVFAGNSKARTELIVKNTATINGYIELINKCHKHLDRHPIEYITQPANLNKSLVLRLEYYQQMIDDRETCRDIYPPLPTHKELYNKMLIKNVLASRINR